MILSGLESGVGNKMAWTSDNPEMGQGTQELTASTTNKRVQTALDLGPTRRVDADFELVPQGAATEVTWAHHTDLGINPMTGWMGLMFDQWVGTDYEAGLANLKRVVEAGA